MTQTTITTTTVKKPDIGSYEPRTPEKKFSGHPIPEKSKLSHPREVYNQARILGAVFGSAVGDALGAPAEFNGRGSLVSQFPDGIREMLPARTTGGKGAGSYTDDTEMLVCIGQGIIDAEAKHDLHNFSTYAAQRTLQWANSSPPDMGGLTSSVTSAIRKGTNHFEAAWGKARNGMADANGAIMRNAILFPFTRSAPHVKAMLVTEELCSITHASHQCRHAAAAMTELMRRLCWSTNPRKAIEGTYDTMKVWGCNPVVLQCFERIISGHYKTAAEVKTGGWVIDTLERALWCLWLDVGYEEALVTCIMMGGDADTAGAVAGALLGTYYGIDGIPTAWVESVKANEAKHRKVSLEEMTLRVAEIGDSFFFPEGASKA